MALPASSGPWPPPDLAQALAKWAEWDAWWSGQPDQIAAIYGGTWAGGRRSGPVNRPSQWAGGIVGAWSRMWWGRPSPANEPEEKLHVPIAGDLARTAADMLFSEPIKVTAQDAATNGRIEELLDDSGHARLIEAAELVAALGGGYLRPVYDRTVADTAWLDCVAPDAAIPVWRWGRLVGVTFWREVHVDRDRDTVWRHLEWHEPGWVQHALYKGTPTELGRAVPLQDMPATADLAELVNGDLAVPTGYDRLDVAYIPHLRPSRTWRRAPLLAPMGRSVLDGCEPLMDALDQTFSSWMRDVDLAAGKVIVPETWLDDRGPGRGASYDPTRRYFAPVPGALGKEMGRPEVVQFAIRVAEHRDTAQDLVEQILRTAGYSTGSIGEIQGAAMGGAKTATEVVADERRSYITRGKQILYWRSELTHGVLPALLAVDAYAFGRPAPQLDELNVEFADAVQEDALTIANTVNMLAAAQAASIATRVRMVHPEWDEAQVAEEVALIRDDAAAAMPAPFDAHTDPTIQGDGPPDGEPPPDDQQRDAGAA